MLRQTVLFSLFLMMALGHSAQTQEITPLEQPVTLTADKPVEVVLTLEPGLWRFTAAATDSVDPTLALISSQGRLLAFGDDYVVDGELVRDAVIRYRVTEPGPYTLLVDSFNGVSEGRLMLSALREPDDVPLGTQPLYISLWPGEVAQVRYAPTVPGTVRVVVTADGMGDPWALVQHEAAAAVFDDMPDPAVGANTLQMAFDTPAPFDLYLRDFAGRRARFIVRVVPAPP
jgi:hypothetical protein